MLEDMTGLQIEPAVYESSLSPAQEVRVVVVDDGSSTAAVDTKDRCSPASTESSATSNHLEINTSENHFAPPIVSPMADDGNDISDSASESTEVTYFDDFDDTICIECSDDGGSLADSSSISSNFPEDKNDPLHTFLTSKWPRNSKVTIEQSSAGTELVWNDEESPYSRMHYANPLADTIKAVLHAASGQDACKAASVLMHLLENDEKVQSAAEKLFIKYVNKKKNRQVLQRIVDSSDCIINDDKVSAAIVN